MTTLAELVAQDPDETHGFPVDLNYGGGGFRAVVQIADPEAGASVVWHDISDRISDIRWRFGASQPRGNQEAGSSTLMLWTTDDSFAPWNEDTSALFGLHVPLNAGLLIRFGVFRVSGFGVQWFPQFTHLVRRWGDASSALGNVRFHKIEAVDLASTLANKPVGAQIEQGHIARLASLLSTWPFGYEAYGVDTISGTPALTYPARAAQGSTLAELRLAARNAGLVVRSLKNGKLIVHPAPRDTWNATQRALPGATGATWSNPIFTYYFDGPHFTYEPASSGDIRFWPEMAGSSFGLESDWEHVVNELTVSTPSGLYGFDDPVSASKFGDRSLPRETWLVANDDVVDDIVTERAYTQFVATPLRFGRELDGGFPAVALIDHLDPVTIVYTTQVGRTVVTSIGQVRSMDHEFKALGGTSAVRQVRWRAALQADIDERSTSSPLLPVEDLALVAVDADSAQFSWTNPTQVVTPTLTQIRIADTNEWTDIPYPSTSVTWLGLRADTNYRFEVRLLREVDGVVEAVSPVRSVTFTTDVGIDGDGDGVVVPDPGVCDVDLKLESSPDAITWTVVATYLDVYGDVVDGVWTPPPGVAADETKLYRWCFREVCGGVPDAWTCGAVFSGTCTAPSILGTAPYDDAVMFVPKVCGLEVREAISETVGTTGTAFGGFGFDDLGGQALTSAAEGTVAYGVADQLADVLTSSATIGVRVKLGASPTGIVNLLQAGGLEIQASPNGVGWSVAGRVLRAGGGSTTISDTAVLTLGTWYDLKLAHDVATGDISLRVNDSEVETGTYVGNRRMFLPVWTIQLPDDSVASTGAVWDTVLAPAVPSATLIAAIMALSPLGYWKLDESGGTTANDSSGNARHGTYTGTGYALASAAGADGASYVDLGNAASSHISIADNNVWSANTAAGLTIFMLVKPDSINPGSRRIPIAKGSAGQFEWGFDCFVNNALVPQAGNMTAAVWSPAGAARNFNTANASVLTTAWNAIAYVIDTPIAAIPGIFRNGSSVGAGGGSSTSTAYANGTAPVRIGWRADSPSPGFWQGGIAHVAIFAGILTGPQIAGIMAAASSDGWF